ncbi:transposase family protein [Frankia sp. AgPm24]|uniref:transposase family protein n=1 Tax=Frankia sp. AgPm24 TaxID=631128 RepID=UPI00200D575A|nr:transposase family protein [Frankia sp. AgPm24]MCK9923752.1 transposase family protein [Frankia sp. AgPm24]
MLEQIPDPRDQRGKIYGLSFVLAVILVATLTGATCLRRGGSRWRRRPWEGHRDTATSCGRRTGRPLG